MAMSRTLYVSDLDGTLLNSMAQLTPFTSGVVNSLIEAGCAFTIASGRTIPAALKLVGALRLELPAILMNGVALFDMGAGFIDELFTTENDELSKALAITKASGFPGFVYRREGDRIVTWHEELVTPEEFEFVEERKREFGESFCETGNLLELKNANSIFYITVRDREERVRRLSAELSGIPGIATVLFMDTYTEDLWMLECFSDKASKRKAVERMRERFGFDRVIGFGDNYNDLSLFEACDEAYAVSGAPDELKRAASGVIGSSDLDGVALWLQANI
jgi:Cof subfamily protein (haloacid dehalogenase superfamily)